MDDGRGIRAISKLFSIYFPVIVCIFALLLSRWSSAGSIMLFTGDMAKIGMINDAGFFLLDQTNNSFDDLSKFGKFLTDSSDWRIRHAAVVALGKAKSPQAFDYLILALRDDNSKIRKVAIGMITLVGNRLSEANRFHPDDARRLLTAVDDLLRDDTIDNHLRFVARKLRTGLAEVLGA